MSKPTPREPAPTLFPVAFQRPDAPTSLPRYPAAPPSDDRATIRVVHVRRCAS